jgi:hypothetical protein
VSHSTWNTHYRLKHILPLHSYNLNDVFLLIISTKTVTLARFHRMLPDDGPNVACHMPHSTQYTHYRLKHILPLHSYNFNNVLLLIISTKTVRL